MPRRVLRCAFGVTVLVLAQIAGAKGAERVDLLLALAMDVSHSIDDSKFLLQRNGYAAAIAHPQVLGAIKAGAHQRIAATFIEWSGPAEQQIMIDWRLVDGATTAHDFSEMILRAPRSFNSSTSIGAGIDFTAAQLLRAPYEAERLIIDVSGDGINNAGHEVRPARDRAIARGITVNGLVMLTDIKATANARHTNPPEGLERYYRDNVIGGRGAFVMVAEDIGAFGRAITRKLIAEIATHPVRSHQALAD